MEDNSIADGFCLARFGRDALYLYPLEIAVADT
jgi:hypothetical protein